MGRRQSTRDHQLGLAPSASSSGERDDEQQRDEDRSGEKHVREIVGDGSPGARTPDGERRLQAAAMITVAMFHAAIPPDNARPPGTVDSSSATFVPHASANNSPAMR